MIDVVREGFAGDCQHNTQHLFLAVARGNECIHHSFSRVAALEERIAKRLAYDSADIDPEDPAALAGMLAAVARGIMLRARSGTPSADLHPIAQVAVRGAIATGR